MGKLVSNLLGGLFGERDPIPAPPPPPPAPAAPDPAAADEAARQREAEDAKNRKRGRAAFLLTGSQGAGTPKTATKTLLGE